MQCPDKVAHARTLWFPEPSYRCAFHCGGAAEGLGAGVPRVFRTPVSPHPSLPAPLAYETGDWAGMEAGERIPAASGVAALTTGTVRKWRRGWEEVLARIFAN